MGAVSAANVSSSCTLNQLNTKVVIYNLNNIYAYVSIDEKQTETVFSSVEKKKVKYFKASNYNVLNP